MTLRADILVPHSSWLIKSTHFILFFKRTHYFWPSFGAALGGPTLVPDCMGSNAGLVTYKAVYHME